jgi:hypothetical protein
MLPVVEGKQQPGVDPRERLLEDCRCERPARSR